MYIKISNSAKPAEKTAGEKTAGRRCNL